MPLRSPLTFEAGSREAVLAAWERFAAERQLDVRLGHEVTAVERPASPGGAVTVQTAAGDALKPGRLHPRYYPVSL